MFDLVGYLSSYFVTLGLAVGFLASAVIFVCLLVYGFSIYLKVFREIFKQEHHPALIPARARLVADNHRKSLSSLLRHE